MEQSEELKNLKYALKILEYHYSAYKDYKSEQSRKNKKRAFSEMMIHAKFLQNQLSTPTVFPIISDGNPFQFEDFWKYVNSDMPGYLEKINKRIEELEK